MIGYQQIRSKIQERYMNINRLCKRTATVSEYNLLDYKPKIADKPKPVRKKKVQNVEKRILREKPDYGRLIR